MNEMHCFSQSRQQLIVITWCALHNFIRMYNRDDEMFHMWEESDVHSNDASIAGDAQVGSGGNEEAFNPWTQWVMTEYRDAITATMWADYTTICGWGFWEDIFVDNMIL